MPYVGRDLQRGNYLKLDDIASSFDGSTTTFNLQSGGSAFYPGSAFSIFVSVGGVIQEPESAYTINKNTITFANAPHNVDDCFITALGVALGVGVPGHGTVNGSQLAKPFNYDGGLLYLDSTNNKIGVANTTPTVELDVNGRLDADYITGIAATFSGNVSIGGTLTYQDVSNIDSVGIITAQAGIHLGIGATAGLMDVATGISTFSKVGIGTANPVGNLEVRDTKANLIVAKDGLTVKGNSALHTTYDLIQLGAGGALASYSTATATADTQFIHNAYRHSGGNWKYRYADTAMRFRMNSPGNAFIFESAASGSADADITFSEKLRIDSNGKIGVGGAPSAWQAATTSKVLQLGNASVFNYNDTYFHLGQNFYWDGSNYKYIANGHSTRLIQNAGEFSFLQAASGSADANITYTTPLKITSAGKVLIGTTNAGNAGQVLTLYRSGTSALEIRSNTSGNSNINFTDGDPPSGNAQYRGYIEYNHSDDYMKFGTAASERLRILSTGEVGIGITNPEAYEANGNNLVVGDTTGHNGITILTGTDKDGRLGFADGTGAASYRGMIEYQHGSGVGEFMKINVAGDERLRITSDGKIGIGSEIPNSKLEVWNGSNIEVLRLKDTHFNKYLTIRGGGSPNRMVIDSYEGGGGGADIDFASNGSTKLRITSTGAIQNHYNTNLPVTDSRPILQLGYSVIGDDSSGYNAVTCNAYPVNGNATWHYIGSSSLGASRYHIGFGDHKWFTAAAGTRGNDITWTERLRINSAGTVRIKRAVSTSMGNDSIFLAIGDTENGTNVNRMIGFGYNSNFGTSVYPASMGFTETDNSGNTRGALTFNTRNTTGATDVPVERLRLASNGNVSIGGADAIPSSSGYDKATLHILQTNSGTSVGCQLKFSVANHGHGANNGGFISFWGDKNFYYNNRENSGLHRFYVKDGSGNSSEKLQIGSTAVYVTGHFEATTKSFIIDHPTKENHRLRYACLEGPENSVYVRGRSSDSVIELPDYWVGLVHDDSITVNVTPIGNKNVWVESINNNSVTIGSDDSTEYFYTVFAERKDVEKLEVEVEK